MKITKDDLDKWDEHIALKKWGKGTVDTYGLYGKELLGQDITQDLINKLLIAKGNNYPSFIRNFLRCFNIRDIEIVRPRGRRKTKESVDYFTIKEMEIILENITDKRLNLIIRLMYEDGLRISEVMNLKKSNFDMVNRHVKGMGKGNVEFKAQIFATTYEQLQDYIVDFNLDDYIFQWDGIVNQRKKAWYEIKKQVGHLLPHKDKKEIYCHAFKHTCGTVLRQKGLDLREIQVALRHKNLETVKHYTHVDREKLNEKLREVFK